MGSLEMQNTYPPRRGRAMQLYAKFCSVLRKPIDEQLVFGSNDATWAYSVLDSIQHMTPNSKIKREELIRQGENLCLLTARYLVLRQYISPERQCHWVEVLLHGAFLGNSSVSRSASCTLLELYETNQEIVTDAVVAYAAQLGSPVVPDNLAMVSLITLFSNILRRTKRKASDQSEVCNIMQKYLEECMKDESRHRTSVVFASANELSRENSALDTDLVGKIMSCMLVAFHKEMELQRTIHHNVLLRSFLATIHIVMQTFQVNKRTKMEEGTKPQSSNKASQWDYSPQSLPVSVDVIALIYSWIRQDKMNCDIVTKCWCSLIWTLPRCDSRDMKSTSLWKECLEEVMDTNLELRARLNIAQSLQRRATETADQALMCEGIRVIVQWIKHEQPIADNHELSCPLHDGDDYYEKTIALMWKCCMTMTPPMTDTVLDSIFQIIGIPVRENQRDFQKEHDSLSVQHRNRILSLKRTAYCILGSVGASIVIRYLTSLGEEGSAVNGGDSKYDNYKKACAVLRCLLNGALFESRSTRAVCAQSLHSMQDQALKSGNNTVQTQLESITRAIPDFLELIDTPWQNAAPNGTNTKNKPDVVARSQGGVQTLVAP